MHHREPLPVGAKCRVRGWDDLVAEFGPVEDGDLIYESEEGIEGRRYISGDMLELIDEQDSGMQIPGDYSALFGMQ